MDTTTLAYIIIAAVVVIGLIWLLAKRGKGGPGEPPTGQ